MDQRDRVDRPRIVLWVGSAFRADAALLEDLHRLPLVAVFTASTDTSINEALLERPSLTARYPMALTTVEEAAAWDSATLPIFYLRGRRQDRSSSLLREGHRRSAMLERFSALAEEFRPSIVALGLDDEPAEIEEMLTVAAEYGSGTPIIIAGDDTRLRALIERIRRKFDSPLVNPEIVAGGWDELKRHLDSAGISLLMDEDELPTLLVGKIPVPLAAIFADPGTRVDQTWRIITAKALRQSPPPDSYESLFDAVMRLDESSDARTVEEDFKEWWGIGDGFLSERPDARSATNRVLAALQGEISREPQILWVAAEAGAGATMFLHSLAYWVARAGFPALIAKQHARDPSSRQLKDFLTQLHDEARRIQGGDYRETPALLVLDVPHALSSAMEDVPDYVLRVGARHVIAVRAVRIEPDAGEPLPGRDRAEWLANQIRGDDADRRLPKKGEPVIAILRSRPTADEISRVEEKAQWLREKRGINLVENAGDTWAVFQERQAYFVDALLRNAGLRNADLEEAKRSFRADQLFWLVLYHFLRQRNKDDREQPLLATLVRRFATVVEAARTAGLSREVVMGVLLEAAKLSAWGIVCPMVALVDWTREQRMLVIGGEAGHDAERGEPARAADAGKLLSPPEVKDAIKRLREWASGVRRSEQNPAESPNLETYRAVDFLVAEIFLRRHNVNGVSYVSVPSPMLARALLLAAFNAPDVIGKPLHDAIGGVRAVLFRDHAFEALSSLLNRLTAAQANIQLCQDLSERLLKGDDESGEWLEGRGEARLAAYDMIPTEIRNVSRVISHHRALVMRRTAFSRVMDSRKKLERLLLAREGLIHALSLPWDWGQRSDHPAFIRTSLGITLEEIANLMPAEAGRWRDQARDALRTALLEKPDSRHPRLALAQYCLRDAKRVVPLDENSVALAAECLRLLAVEPTAMHHKWYSTKKEAADLFGNDAGQRYVDELCSRNVEDGFLLKTELILNNDPNRIREALNVLEPLIVENRASTRPRACRRAAELMLLDDAFIGRFEDRSRMLKLVESDLERLTPIEEYQLAYLAYQLGDFADGRKRFTLLRATGRHTDAVTTEQPFLVNRETDLPLRCRGVVIRIEGGRGWMRLEKEAGGGRLFDAPFMVRHFADTVKANQLFPARVRFSEKGPQAVPESFARTKRG